MNELNHFSYEKISSDFKKYKLTAADYRLFKKTDWIVTEKIHGANFCILTDGIVIKYAKRKEVLTEEDDFFGYQTLTKGLEPKAIAIFTAIKNIYPDTKQIAIYGELFGGEYPHPEAKENVNVDAIQTGVYYSPNIEFLAFDIAYINNKQKRNYLDCDRVLDFCHNAQLNYIPILFRGKYEDAIAYNIHFTTTIPSLLNLPSLTEDNLAEGIVIKPANNFLIDTSKGKLRPVLKIKIAQFAEDKRFHQAQKWNYRQQALDKQISYEILEQEVLALVTINRFNNLISKIGKPKNMNKKKREYILQLYIKDVIADLENNLDIVFADLNSKMQTELTLLIEREAHNLF